MVDVQGRRHTTGLARSRAACLAGSSALWLACSAAAQDTLACTQAQAWVVSVQGTVQVRRAAARPSPEPEWSAVSRDTGLCIGDSVRVMRFGRAALRLNNETTMRLDQGTVLSLAAPTPGNPTLIEQMSGRLHVITRPRRAFRLSTPFVNANIEGTEFSVQVEADRATVAVVEGSVEAFNASGQVTLADGEQATALAGPMSTSDARLVVEAPLKSVTVRSADAAAWTLYLPAVLDHQLGGPGPLAAAAGEASVALYRRGRIADALDRMGTPPADSQRAAYLVYRAALLLIVGRFDEARPDLAEARRLEPAGSDALALQAVAALALNDKAAALAFAKEATRLDPASPGGWIALSYVQQAQFEIEQALGSVQVALQHDPTNALAHARRAELEMSSGRLEVALAAAQQAARLNPELGRTQTVLGFANLVRIDVPAARASFERAIALDPADPLPRLGLGLARIRDGDLSGGRAEIEIAAILDPRNSLVRSYLGKAYVDEGRGLRAQTQFELAKSFDTNDPTPWFYDALRKQADGRPVQALQDLETSIRLNDRRAAYRSRLLLDRDLAARSVSLATIYDGLGFERLGFLEASNSLALDPASFSAHRFLADIYAALPRHEVGRISEILQAQLLGPLSLNPVQPNLLMTADPLANGYFREASLSEYTTLFERNRLQLRTNGIVGSQGKQGSELVLSGIQDRWAFSIGSLNLRSDGFRPNNDLSHRADNAFIQFTQAPSLSVQAELRSEHLRLGDLALNDDPDVFSDKNRRELNRRSARLGMHLSPTASSDVIASLVRIDWREGQHFDFGDLTIDTDLRNRGTQAELQYLHRSDSMAFVAGIGAATIDTHEIDRFDGIDDPPIAVKVRQNNAYVYATLSPRGSLQWSLGLSHDSRREAAAFSVSRFNPKFGLRWQPTEALAFRVAAFSTVTRTISGSQSIEPTQVAGFDQFFDDPNGTKAVRRGFGVDYKLREGLSVGLELSGRDVKKPQLLPDETVFEDQRERTANGYVYWVAGKALTLKIAPELDWFKRSPKLDTGPTPTRVRTSIVPLALRFFPDDRLSGRIVLNHVDQRVDRLDDFAPMAGSDRFFTIDGSLSYRLLSRRILIGIEGRNLTGRRFRFQDESYRKIEPETPRFAPVRTISATISLRF